MLGQYNNNNIKVDNKFFENVLRFGKLRRNDVKY
jgi:hypothetical protein